MQVRQIPMAQLRELLDEQLAHGEALLPVTGNSMWPLLAGGRDMVRLARLDRRVQPGDIALYQKADGSYKISLRTGTHANAAEICRVLGGGGHPAAAGCTVNLPLSEAIDKIVAVIGDTVDGIRD